MGALFSFRRRTLPEVMRTQYANHISGGSSAHPKLDKHGNMVDPYVPDVQFTSTSLLATIIAAAYTARRTDPEKEPGASPDEPTTKASPR